MKRVDSWQREKTCTLFRVHPGAIYTFCVLLLLHYWHNLLFSMKIKIFEVQLKGYITLCQSMAVATVYIKSRDPNTILVFK